VRVFRVGLKEAATFTPPTSHTHTHTHTNTLTAARDWRLCAREPSKGKTGAHYTCMWIERKKGKNFSLSLNNLQVCGSVFSPRVFI